MSFINNYLRVKEKFNNEFNRHLEKYGHLKIIKIYICRKPLNGAVEGFLNIATLGKFNAEKNKNFTVLFHLYLMLLLENGMFLLLEKNQQPELKPSDISNVNNSENIMVYYEPNHETVDEFVMRGLKFMGNSEFFIYDGITSNCQIFVTNMLKANDLWDTTYDLFVNQSVGETIGKIPYFKKLIRKITDTGAIFDQLRGKGQLRGRL